MKKVKFMLTSIALIAVVGGALAFKAKFSTSYCTAPVEAGGTCPDTCPDLIQAQKTTNQAGIAFVCTTTSFANVNDDCKDPSTGAEAPCSNVTTKLVSDATE